MDSAGAAEGARRADGAGGGGAARGTGGGDGGGALPARRPVTVVTGGGRGIGAAICARLAADGHDIALAYVNDPDAAARTAEAVRARGSRCVTVRVDISREGDVDLLFDTAAAELGPVTGLVNNAAVTGPLGRLADVSTDVLRRVVDVNLMGTLLCSRRAVREMTARAASGTADPGAAGKPPAGAGAIVNVSSAAATLGSPGEYVHYAATKAAVDALTVGLSKELGPEGVRVNAVAPGLVDTDMHAAMGDPDRPARMAPGIPLRRAGEPEEIAAAVAWLLSPEASYISGTVLRAAGGR
ncbi:SDR family oxidoreductase [Streptomyces fuscigenes]|uniref:SDR family oxidoreductase n=1 Tax=Streptomyces fuscigenes TaxID=1528880 RepID=UPI001F40CBC2|nr:SDR family oxidoreductase [Streptomyces fuscigenes]MCF3963295.1 SDR family oxidoreductase [Streptomyces fuscigenes]